MFDNFQSFRITTQKDPLIQINGLHSNNTSLPPLLLLHGFPESLHIWHLVAPRLTSKYNVILMDLRGYGESTKLAQPIAAYAKSAMARDCIGVMDGLGISGPFYVCAHDRGARVAHKLCVDYPERVKSVIFLDICPTLAMYSQTDMEFAKSYWHWFFLIQKEPLPERLISGNVNDFIDLFMGGRQEAALGIFAKENIEYYKEVLSDPAAVHSMCHDYRASATFDLDEAREDLKNGRLLKCPVKVLWGKHGVIEKCFDAVKEWQAVTDKSITVVGHSTDSGHYIPEQVPEHVISEITEFFKE